MDIMMPEIDGVEVMHSLKELDEYNLPPIVAITGNALPGMKASYIKEGFDDYIAKPIEKKELERVLIKFLQNKIEE
jgi:CheY-like chemotaxis protein